MIIISSKSEFTMEEHNSNEAIRPNEVLKAIKKCIEAFWSYINTDNKKSLWKCSRIRRTRPPVEDPIDLELLYDVTKALQKVHTFHFVELLLEYHPDR